MCSAIPRRIARHRLERLARLESPRRPAGAAARRCRRRGAVGAGAGAAARCGGRGGAGAGAGERPVRPPLDSTKARMSFFVTRPPRPGSRHLRRVDAVLGGDPRDDRRDERVAVAVLAPARSARPAPAARRGCGRRPRSRPARLVQAPPARGLGRRPGGAAPARQRGGCALPASSPIRASTRADVDRLALLDEDLADDARCRARHLGVDLVGRDLEQRLVGLDRVADVLQPLRDGALGDGDAHLRHHDVDCGSVLGHLVLGQLAERRRRRRRPAG